LIINKNPPCRKLIFIRIYFLKFSSGKCNCLNTCNFPVSFLKLFPTGGDAGMPDLPPGLEKPERKVQAGNCLHLPQKHPAQPEPAFIIQEKEIECYETIIPRIGQTVSVAFGCRACRALGAFAAERLRSRKPRPAK
jgi:hypothetical protein